MVYVMNEIWFQLVFIISDRVLTNPFSTISSQWSANLHNSQGIFAQVFV